MDGLEEWMVPGGEGDQVFPCLEKLCIEGCGMLKSIPICHPLDEIDKLEFVFIVVFNVPKTLYTHLDALLQ